MKHAIASLALTVLVVCGNQSELEKLINFQKELVTQVPQKPEVVVERVIELKLP